MSDITPSLLTAFGCKNAVEKAHQVRNIVADLNAGTYRKALPNDIPDRPGRPDTPQLLPPKDVPRRRVNASPNGRIALIHAIAHIELNAIDLAIDMAARFTRHHLPFDFVRDWLSVADDEARHFLMLNDRLGDLGSYYGALVAHDGLWQAAESTKEDLLGRLAIAPLVLEARGLDITPQLITKLTNVGDKTTAACFEIIMTDEVGHVAIGKKWFDYQCGMERADPISRWQGLVRTYFHGKLKPPFNIEARNAARFSAAFYRPVADDTPSLQP